MQTKSSYASVEAMIQQKKVMLFELKHLIDSLERRELITPAEYRALLRLGQKVLPQLPLDPQTFGSRDLLQ
jgi:hypothetical protein